MSCVGLGEGFAGRPVWGLEEGTARDSKALGRGQAEVWPREDHPSHGRESGLCLDCLGKDC